MSRNGHRQTRVDLNSLKNLEEWSERKLWQEIKEGEKACGLTSEEEVKESDMSVASEESFLHDQKPFETKEKTDVEMGEKLRKADMDADENDDDHADSFQDLMKRIQAAKIQPISEEEFERRSEAVRTMTEDSSKILRYGLAKNLSSLNGQPFCPKKMCIFTKRRRGPKIQSKAIEIKSRDSFLERDEVLDLAEEMMRIQDWTEEFQKISTQTRTADNPVSIKTPPAVTAGSQKHEASPAVVISEEVKQETPSFRKSQSIFRKKRMKVLLVAVAAGIAVFGGTMVASGKREYNYGIYPIVGKQNLVMKNNAVLDTADDLETAYQRIEDELGIPVLELGHIPKEMKFKSLAIERNIAILKFQYQGKNIYLREEKKLFSKETFQSKVSDRVPFSQVYNKLLNKNIVIEKNVLQDNLVEYSVQIEENDAEYYLSGMINEEEFLTILEGLMFR
ncbi:hypothetical protein [Brotaphodocola sp.]|uniref:hypothetical protein n=1 Tax=Brotaphodocola sp. TaxID=3073577 RepID=UPI003D7C94FC